MSILGIDVSHHQKTIDWGKVAKDGIKFAIMKVMNERTQQPDECFEANYRGCTANGIKRGAYIFLGSKSIENPCVDANNFLNILDGRELEYGIWLDAEAASLRAMRQKDLTELLMTEAEIFEKAGYRVGIYTNRDWYIHVLDIGLFLNRFPFWVARYPLMDDGTMVARLSPKEYAEAWQYSSKGKVKGIQTVVDRDIDYGYEEWERNFTIALEVIAGKWGSASTTPSRQEQLAAAGYSYKKIQNMVNAYYCARARK